MSGPTQRGELHWAVKDSFVHYVRTVAAGTCEASDGAEPGTDGTWLFPLLGAEQDADVRTLSFEGRLRFQAHHGFLDVELQGLELRLTARGGELGIRTADGDRVILATTAPAVPTEDGGRLRWPALVPYLTEAGSEVFGNVYPAGSEFAPLDIVVLVN